MCKLKRKIAVVLPIFFLALLLSLPARIVTAERENNGRNRVAVQIVVADATEPSSQIAINRLQEYGDFTAEIHEAISKATNSISGLTIILGEGQSFPVLQKQWAKHSSAKKDSYLIKTISTKPLVVIASGVDQRGTLYAAYHLADLLRAKTKLSAIDIFREPRIAERYVSFGATTHGRRIYNPEQHWKTLKELPSFGYSGMIIYPGGGTPIGRRASPVAETKKGELYLDPTETKKWKDWFSEIKKYRLDIMMTLPPIIPPGYSNAEIDRYYGGGPEPEGYISALQSHFRKYLELIKKAYLEADNYMFNSTEGATFGRNARFFGHPDTKHFSNETYLQNNEKIMKAYFDVLTDFFKSAPDKVFFWTHSFGLTSEGIVKMREVLFQYPKVTIIEDDFWNNNLWPHDLPAMAYLPKDLRAEVSSKNPFALFQIATDGEYHGGGSVPNAYPDSHIRSANEAVDRHARMVIQRLDLHDRTPQGTTFGTMKIVPLAASRQLWKPTLATSQIWQEWAESRFGREAAPFVVKALQESKSVLRDGLSCNGLDLLCVGSEFAPRLWMKDDSGVTRFFLFGKPGERLVKKDSGDLIFSGEYTAWQMDTHSISIKQFRENQEKARSAVARGLQQIEKAKPHLAMADYEMLHGIFTNGANVLQTVLLLGEAAYATNIQLDNFDHVKNPEALFGSAIAQMETWLAKDKLIPEMTGNLTKILESYKALAADRKENGPKVKSKLQRQ